MNTEWDEFKKKYAERRSRLREPEPDPEPEPMEIDDLRPWEKVDARGLRTQIREYLSAANKQNLKQKYVKRDIKRFTDLYVENGWGWEEIKNAMDEDILTRKADPDPEPDPEYDAMWEEIGDRSYKRTNPATVYADVAEPSEPLTGVVRDVQTPEPKVKKNINGRTYDKHLSLHDYYLTRIAKTGERPSDIARFEEHKVDLDKAFTSKGALEKYTEQEIETAFMKILMHKGFGIPISPGAISGRLMRDIGKRHNFYQ